ncbi:MAG: recombinase family protein [Candidatus Bathyarchaeia archaeon]|nr:recombinase family protein [Candidatus Bathyarchaeota archaeon]
MKAIGYVRVSTREQDEEVQLKAIKEFLETKGFELVKIYVDKGEPGAKPFIDRPSASQLVKEIDILKPDFVVAWSLDRLGRTMLDTMNTVLMLEERNVKVLTIKEEFLQTLDPNIRKLILSILAWVAEYERRRIRERQEEAWKQGKIKGRPKKINDEIILQYYQKYRRYGNKKYIWLRLCEDYKQSVISYDRFLKRLKQLLRN